jgi:ADP-ribose pyrophosphatase YjhB (NUDIX family)
MGMSPQKYWHDLVLPIVRGEQAVVFHDQLVLLVRRDKPLFWGLPGGGMAAAEAGHATYSGVS